MKTKILWINPVGTPLFDGEIQDYLDTHKHPDTDVHVVSLHRGPMHLEYHFYEALALPDTLHRIREGEKQGYDGAVIGCFYDPGLREARELTRRMVVTGPAESALHIAATLGDRFSILVGRKKWIPKMRENVANLGFLDKLASFRSLDMGVYDFQKDRDDTRQRIKKAALAAIEADGAEVIILGCTIEFGFYESLQDELKIPVIDAVLAPLKYMEFLTDLKRRFNWGHSKIGGYEGPPAREMEEWKLSEQYGFQNTGSGEGDK